MTDPLAGRDAARAQPASARRSSMRAVTQSRCTVRTVTPNADAISASVSPPKKRHSTTRTSRGDSVPRYVIASSSCSSASGCTSAEIASSSSVTRIRSPPRLSVASAFARSTRTWRMAIDATARKCTRSFHSPFGPSASLRYASWTSAVVVIVPPRPLPPSWRCAIARSSA